jgi:hypothetical protein
MNRMADLLLGVSRDERRHVLRSVTSLAACAVSAEVDIIDLDLGSKQAGLDPPRQCSQDLVVLQPDRVVIHTQVSAELQRGDGGRELANQIKARSRMSVIAWRPA